MPVLHGARIALFRASADQLSRNPDKKEILITRYTDNNGYNNDPRSLQYLNKQNFLETGP